MVEGPGGRFRQERRVEHEVLGAHDRGPVAAEQPRDISAGEPAADDQRAAARLLLEHGSDRKRSARKARSCAVGACASASSYAARRPRRSGRAGAGGRRAPSAGGGTGAGRSRRSGARPASGPSAIAIATARLRATTGPSALSRRALRRARRSAASRWRRHSEPSCAVPPSWPAPDRHPPRRIAARSFDQRLPFGDLGSVPTVAGPGIEEHEVALGGGAGPAPPVMQEHERERNPATSGSCANPSCTSRVRRMASTHRSSRSRSSPAVAV